MNSYKSSAELKALSKEQLFGNYGTAICASLTVLVITALMQYIPMFTLSRKTIIGSVIYYLITFILALFSGLFSSGTAFFYLKLACGQPISVTDIFYGFKLHPDKALFIQFIISVLTYICLIPGLIFESLYLSTGNVYYMLFMSLTWIAGITAVIIISLMYSQAFFLLQDFPAYSGKELMKMSRTMMKGHKGRLFYLNVSFLPLYLLGLLSCCIAYLWIIPYSNAAHVNFYMDLVKNKNTNETN